MILGKLILNATTLETTNDTYVLESVSTISTRRPFLASGILICSLAGSLACSFQDILTLAELSGLLSVAGVSLGVGLTLGRLQLVSRDLKGLPLADAVYGTHRDLNQRRPSILAAIERAKRERGVLS